MKVPRIAAGIAACVLLTAAPAAAKTTLSVKEARSVTSKVMQLELADEFGLADRMGSGFTLRFAKCERRAARHVRCWYVAKGETGVREAGRWLNCTIDVDVRKRNGAKRATWRRDDPDCFMSSSVYARTAGSRARITPLDVRKAKGRAVAVIRQERANKFKARERIGGPFTVALKYCEMRELSSRPDEAICAYWITAKSPTSTAPDGSPVRRRCVVKLTVRQSRKTGRVTHTRRAQPCYEPQPPTPGPPVGAGA